MNANATHTLSEREDLNLSSARDCILDVDANADYSISLAENYAWVDELLEKKYYDYISEDEDDISLNYETFSQNETQAQEDQDETDFVVLISDLKNLISYHEDRRRRRNKLTDDVFSLFNELNMDV